MGIRTGREEVDKIECGRSEQDLNILLQQYGSDEMALILKYRDALNQQVQYGIDGIGLVEEKYNDILKNLEQKEQKLKNSTERQKQLFQIKSAIAFADNKNYLYGPFRDILRNEDLQEKIEIVEAAEEHNQQDIDLDDVMEEQIVGKAR